MLFEEYSNFDYKFPDPQYLGAKHTHLAWIKSHIPKKVKTALDAFAGSQSISFLFKQMGFKTITNDFLNFNHQIGLSLIENREEKITKGDLDILFNENHNSHDFTLIEDVYTNVFFEKEDAKFLDNYRSNIQLLSNIYKQSLAFTIMNRSMTRKVTMGHFGHTQALKYANDPERVKRNRSLARPIKDIFIDLLSQYNQAVFDNNQENKSYNHNILDIIPQIDNVDLAYFDPPYCNSHADYQSFYHLLETYTEYWKDKDFINGIKRYEPQKFSGFDKKKDVINSFDKLFKLSQDIPHWIISYNDRSFPIVDDLKNIISKYKDVSVEFKSYGNGRGGKGSVAGSREVLFVCKPKKQIFFNNDLNLIGNERF
ncbi:DNA adenine methylase [Dyadobacter sediminis]|uniref:DNA methyltransferase n=1 Tax=Dyadobacter sediminis TaxID=1493691 RepID=A0A5R9KM02_9BACT|nr:DNA adenine methylase [Dyadobacter sediminis]TLU97247.1 DNA methyltransferase [Dyadobacter sediminis]GGC16028.1 (2Fe-2S)-binding protein [Dyadobacter sediminis]